MRILQKRALEMKTCIYTFSGTGTALSIADQVCDILGDAAVRLIPQLLEKSNGKIDTDAPRIGLIFPNYFGGIPNAVQRFLHELNIDSVDYIFAVVTAGGGQGYSLKFLQRALQEKGKALNYGRYVKGLSNYIVAGYYRGTAVDKQERVLRAMHEKISTYSWEIKENKNFVERSSPVIYRINRILSTFSSRKMLNDTSGGDSDFSAGDRCIGCGICKNVCQANNIEISGGKPVFRHRCYRCMACIQYCPQNAILFKNKEMNKVKYTNPDFPAAKMILRIQESRNDQ